MPLVLAVLFASGLTAMSCAVFPPCYAVRPGLVVAIAEVVDGYSAPEQPLNPTLQVPIRMRLRKLIYGHSPGQEFTLQWFGEVSLRAGELIYIEESNAPLRTRACGQTGPIWRGSESRQQFFQELAAGKHQGTYVRIAFRTAAHSAIRLSGPTGTIENVFDARGVTEWRNLPPGRYTVHPARSGFTLDERNDSNPTFQLLPGACVQFLFDPKYTEAMRPALALLFATATTWATSCSTPPPCSVLAPDLTVALAEILESPRPAGDSYVPVRMRLKTLIYGRSPGTEFTFRLPSSYNLPIGSLFYIESRQPLQTEVCGLSGPYNARQDDERIRVFQKLAAAPARKAAFHVHASGRLSNALSGVKLTLRDRSDVRHQTTDIEGNADWRGLPPGRYTLSASHSDLQPEDPAETLAPVDILPGSCTGRYVKMLPPYSLTGVARTRDNRPAQGLPVYLRDSDGVSIADTTIGPTGAFTLRHLPAGTYTLFAGDSPGHRSPYPPYLYPGVTSESAATALQLGPGHQVVPLQIDVPAPAPVRTIQLKLPRPLRPMETPILSTGPTTIYTRTWSADRTVCTLTLPPMQPLTGTLRLLPSRLKPFEFSIAAGTELVTLPVRLQLAK